MPTFRHGIEHGGCDVRLEFTCLSLKRIIMSGNVNKGSVLLAGMTTAAVAVGVVAHMYAIDWVGKKVREYVRSH